ncbi:hypothetical protein PoMZ_03880, partial [Pyricularia oryzae]
VEGHPTDTGTYLHARDKTGSGYVRGPQLTVDHESRHLFPDNVAPKKPFSSRPKGRRISISPSPTCRQVREPERVSEPRPGLKKKTKLTLYGKVGYPWWCGSLAVRTITKIPVAIKVRKDCGTAAVTF